MQDDARRPESTPGAKSAFAGAWVDDEITKFQSKQRVEISIATRATIFDSITGPSFAFGLGLIRGGNVSDPEISHPLQLVSANKGFRAGFADAAGSDFVEYCHLELYRDSRARAERKVVNGEGAKALGFFPKMFLGLVKVLGDGRAVEKRRRPFQALEIPGPVSAKGDAASWYSSWMAVNHNYSSIIPGSGVH
ncbi:hypothetical protein S40288_10827 [Stachybotrys chartarum IBT 40288]|nr:hypothetical protein S40288_10827 [Stachybotrys chartarum IBT 40288]